MLSILLSALPLALPAAQNAELPTGLVELLPENTVGLVVVPSLDAIDGAFSRFVRLAVPDAKDGLPTVGELILLFASFDLEQVDRSQPIALALGLPVEGLLEFAPVLLLPATHVQGLAESVELERGAPEVITRGNYVGVPLASDYTATLAEGSITEGLPLSLVSLRLDVARIVRGYGPMIDMGLRYTKQMYEALAIQEDGFDVAKLMALYVDGFDALLRSAGTLDLSIAMEDSSFELGLELGLLEGSSIAELHSPQPSSLEPLFGELNGEASMNMLMSLDWESLQPRLEPFVEAAAQVYPEEAHEFIGRYLGEYGALLPLLGSGTAIDMDLGAGGVEITYRLAPKDGQVAMDAVSDLLRKFQANFASIGLDMGEMLTRSVAGVSVNQFPWSLDASLMQGFGAGVDTGELEAIIHRVYGENLSFSIGTRADRLILHVGSSESRLEEAFAGSRGSVIETSRALRTVTDRLSGANPAFAMRVDVARLMARASEVLGISDSAPQGLTDFEFAYYFGIHAASLRAGLVFEPADLGRFVVSMDESEAREDGGTQLARSVSAKLLAVRDEAGARSSLVDLERLASELEAQHLDLGARALVTGAVQGFLAVHPPKSAVVEILGPVLERLIQLSEAEDADSGVSPFVYEIF